MKSLPFPLAKQLDLAIPESFPATSSQQITFRHQTALHGLRVDDPGTTNVTATISQFVWNTINESSRFAETFLGARPRDVQIYVKGAQKAELTRHLLPWLPDYTDVTVIDVSSPEWRCPPYSDLGLPVTPRTTSQKARAVTNWLRIKLLQN